MGIDSSRADCFNQFVPNPFSTNTGHLLSRPPKYVVSVLFLSSYNLITLALSFFLVRVVFRAMPFVLVMMIFERCLCPFSEFLPFELIHNHLTDNRNDSLTTSSSCIVAEGKLH